MNTFTHVKWYYTIIYTKQFYYSLTKNELYGLVGKSSQLGEYFTVNEGAREVDRPTTTDYLYTGDLDK